MKTITLSLIATIALVSNSAHALYVTNSEQCNAHNSAAAQDISYSLIETADEGLSQAAAAIDSVGNQPQKFLGDVTAGTLVRTGQTIADVSDTTAEAIEKMVRFTFEEAPEKMFGKGERNLGERASYLVITPAKVLTVAGTSVLDGAGDITVGLFNVGSGLLGAAGEFSDRIATRLQNAQSLPTTAGKVLSVPFVVVAWGMEVGQQVGKVLFVNTIAGGLNQMSLAGGTILADVCDMAADLGQFNLPGVVGHAIGLGIDLVAEGVNLVDYVIYNITIGYVGFGDLRERGQRLDLDWTWGPAPEMPDDSNRK